MHAVARDWRGAELAPTDRALCEFAAKLTHEQQDKMNKAAMDMSSPAGSAAAPK